MDNRDGEQNLTGMLVDGNGNLVGSRDGSGTTILTSAEYSAHVPEQLLYF